jgi:hypothetical protein
VERGWMEKEDWMVQPETLFPSLLFLFFLFFGSFRTMVHKWREKFKNNQTMADIRAFFKKGPKPNAVVLNKYDEYT